MIKRFSLAALMVLTSAAPAWANAGTGGLINIVHLGLLYAVVIVLLGVSGARSEARARKGNEGKYFRPGRAFLVGCAIILAGFFTGLGDYIGLAVSLVLMGLVIAYGATFIAWSFSKREPVDGEVKRPGPARLAGGGLALVAAALALTFFFAIASVPGLIGTPPRQRSLDSSVKSALKNLATAQEDYYVRFDHYSDNLAFLEEYFTPDAAVDMRILGVNAASWSAAARHEESDHMFTYDSSRGGLLR